MNTKMSTREQLLSVLFVFPLELLIFNLRSSNNDKSRSS